MSKLPNTTLQPPSSAQSTPPNSTLRFARNASSKSGSLAAVSASQAMRYGIDRETVPTPTGTTAALSFTSVSALDRNVIFQDMDRPKSRNNQRETGAVEEVEQAVEEPDSRTMGLIGNVFLGSTSKYVKGVELASVTTSKGKDTIQQVADNPNPWEGVSAGGKFSRNREQKDVSESRYTETKSRVGVGRDLVTNQEGPSTDRSNATEGGRKIERRQERVRDLKFREKNEKAENMVDLGMEPQVSNFTNSQYDQSESRLTVREGEDYQEVTPQPTIIVSKASTITQRRIASQIQESWREQAEGDEFHITLEKVPSSRITKATAKVQEPKTNTRSLVRSPVFFLLLRRLFKNKQSESLSFLKTNRLFSRIHNSQELNLLTTAVTLTVAKKLTNLKSNSFQALKKRFAAVYIAQLKPYSTAEIKTNRNLMAAVLDRLHTAKMRVSWGMLIKNRELGELKLKIVRTVGAIERRKAMRNLQGGFEELKVRGKRREVMVGQLCKIGELVNKQKLYGGFAQLYRFTRKTTHLNAASESIKQVRTNKVEVLQAVAIPDNPLLIQKIETLTQSKQIVEVEIAELTSRAGIKKSEGNNHHEERSHKMGLLSQQNEQMKVELQARRNRNQLLRLNVDKLSPIHDHPSNEEEDKQTKLSTLTNFYITFYRDSQQTHLASEIAQKYNLCVEDGNSIISEWESMLANIQLKRTVARYENIGERAHKARQSLMNEQSLVCKLVRSYTSELYCWEWIHLSQQ